MSSIYDDFATYEPDDADVGLDPNPVVDGVARLLELAVQNADELVAEANVEAEQIKARARAHGDQLLAECRTQGDLLLERDP